MEDCRSPRGWREKKGRRGGWEGVDKKRGGVFRNRADDEDPICSLRGLSVGSAEEYQGGEQALNLIVTLRLFTSSTSPSRVRTQFYLKGLVRIKRPLQMSNTRGNTCCGSPHH